MIKIECRGRAVFVEDTEDSDTILLEFVPLAPDDDADEAVAALSATYGVEQGSQSHISQPYSTT
jgi:hypothetical protein